MRAPIPATAFLAATLLVSCQSPVDPELVHHVITLSEEGSPVAVEDERELSLHEYELRLGDMLHRADEECGRRYAEARRAGPRDTETGEVRKLLIHIHGGLNTRSSSLENALRSIDAIEAESFGDWHYPLFVSWPSAAMDSYGEHLFELRGGIHAPVLGTLTSPLFLAADIGRSVARFPRTLAYGASTDACVGAKVAFDVDLSPLARRADLAYRFLEQDPELGRRYYNVNKGDYSRGFQAQAGRFLWYWTTLPLTMPITALVVDGMGQSAWEVMKHRAANTIHRTEEFEGELGEDRATVEAAVTRGAEGGFQIFLECLLQHIDAQHRDWPLENGPLRYEITFVAHSMGAFLVNDALTNFPELPIKNIVYMAPACSVGEGAASIVAYLKSHNEGLPLEDRAQFYLLTLHPIAEQDETNYLGIPPRGSLLEWIDNWYDPPNGHPERRLGKWDNILSAIHLFRDVSRDVHVKAFGVRPGSMPQKHGEFNLCPFWRRSFWDPDGRMLY